MTINTENINQKAFFAYPSFPPSLSETIEEAIDQINKGQLVQVISWKNLGVNGKYIISEILKIIDECPIFMCDLTNLNFNVLFELGYAIAKNKKIWICIDLSTSNSKDQFNKFSLLNDIGYCQYTNSRQIIEKFYADQPQSNINDTLYNQFFENILNIRNEPIDNDKVMNTLFYIKSSISTNASIALTRELDNSFFDIKVHDPVEVVTVTFVWYLRYIVSTFGTVVHLMSEEQEGSFLHNARNSLFSGIAVGFGKNLLMLAQDPFDSPIDYKQYLRVHSTANECRKYIQEWVAFVENQTQQIAYSSKIYNNTIKANSELQQIYLGDYLAENESINLNEYFIQTNAFREALDARSALFVGRKGAGKTANFYMLEKEIKKDKRNHVCIIKPVAYELEGMITMLKQSMPISEKGFLIESFWKFLLYTELANSVYESIKENQYYTPNKNEEKLIEYIEKNSTLILKDFAIRLENAVNTLKYLEKLDIDTNEERRLKISEFLHSSAISKLRGLLANVLVEKSKIVILIDNLDKAWKREQDLQVLCDLLIGLLEVQNVLVNDLNKYFHNGTTVNMSIITFLRYDIMNYILGYIQEKDKIKYSLLTWEDEEVLIRILEERFINACDKIKTPEMMWNKYFCDQVKSIETKKYILKTILPKPRDLIFFAKAALDNAISRRHSKIEEGDILEAEKAYSNYALESLIAECENSCKQIESILYYFAGYSEIFSENYIMLALIENGVEESELNEIIDILIKLTFLGFEVSKDKFEFMYNQNEEKKMKVLANRVASLNSDKQKRYKINKAFHAFLEITT